MNYIWQGIAAGLGAGMQQLGGSLMQQHFSEQAQQDKLDQQKLAAELKQQADQAAAEATKQREIFLQSIKPPTTQSYKTMDDAGNEIQKTNSLKFNPTTMQYDTTELGSAPLMGQYSLGQQTQGDDQQSVLVNHATGKVTPTGTAGPRYGVHPQIGGTPAPKPIRAADLNNVLRGTDVGTRQSVYQWLNDHPGATAGDVAAQVQAQSSNPVVSPFDPNSPNDPNNAAAADQLGAATKALYKPGKAPAPGTPAMGTSGAQPQGPGSSRNNPVVVMSAAQAQALQPGTWIRLPNGQIGQR